MKFILLKIEHSLNQIIYFQSLIITSNLRKINTLKNRLFNIYE